MANPNHDWELHTVDFNACLLTLDNIDEGEGLLILSHDSDGCYVGFVHLLKQGFNGLCIAASIFVPQNLAVDGNTLQHLIDEVRKQLRGTMLNTAALDHLFATEYPDKDYLPPFEPQHGKTIACRIEEWTDDTLQLLLDSRCLFQPAYAQHRAVLLIDAQSGIVCDGINISDVPVVIPEPEPAPEPEPVPEIIVEPEVVETSEPEVLEEPEPEVTVIEDVKTEDPVQQEESDQGDPADVEVVVIPSTDEDADVEQANLDAVSYSRELGDENEALSSDDGVEVLDVPSSNDGIEKLDKPSDSNGVEMLEDFSGDDGVEVVKVYPMPPVPPTPPEIEVDETNAPLFGIAELPTDSRDKDSAGGNAPVEPSHNENGGSSKSSTKMLAVFIALLVLGIVVVFIANYHINNSDSSNSGYDADFSASDTAIYVPEELSVDADTADMKRIIYEAYVNKLETLNYEMGEDEFGEYFLHDITGDGIPELWVTKGTCEADYTLYVYRYDVNGLTLMHYTSASHSSFYCGSGYVIQMMAHMGEAVWYRLTLNGSDIDEEVVREETDEYGAYTYPDEPEADVYEFDETQPIADELGV